MVGFNAACLLLTKMAQKPLGKGNSKKKIQKVGKGLKKVSGNKGKLYEKTKKGSMIARVLHLHE